METTAPDLGWDSEASSLLQSCWAANTRPHTTPTPLQLQHTSSSQTLMHASITWDGQMQTPRLHSSDPASFGAGPGICLGTNSPRGPRWI